MLQLSGSCPSTFIVYKKQGNTFDIISPTSNCTISSQGELFSSRKCALRAFEQIFGLTKLVERSVPKRSCNQPWWKICLKKKFYTSDFPRQQKPLRPPQALALSPGKPSNATGDGVWGVVGCLLSAAKLYSTISSISLRVKQVFHIWYYRKRLKIAVACGCKQ